MFLSSTLAPAPSSPHPTSFLYSSLGGGGGFTGGLGKADTILWFLLSGCVGTVEGGKAKETPPPWEDFFNVMDYYNSATEP